MKPNEMFAQYFEGMKEPRRPTLYEEVWECRFRKNQEVVEEPEPKAFASELATGLERLFGKIGAEARR